PAKGAAMQPPTQVSRDVDKLSHIFLEALHNSHASYCFHSWKTFHGLCGTACGKHGGTLLKPLCTVASKELFVF
ncbi:hypothetical protein ACQ4OD_25300, partial [Pseudomonas sp. WC1]|uniref:hypothetical protein n=1 Tax=Pseudomonas sp. WC1 TaxID=3424772 RepID=UPI003D34A26F